MSKPYKNLLQEHYQKIKLQLPEYNSIKNSQGLWQATVTTACNHSFTSLYETTKKEAENNAAERAYIFLQQTMMTTKNLKTVSITQKVATIMDINMNNYSKIILVDG